MIAIIVHGGAGNWPADKHTSAKAGCEAARDTGYRLLSDGASALDAVERAVRLLEDDPLFNAGTGSHPNTAGEVEMDALIVDGAARDFGAVAGIRNVQHPVSVARKVMESTPHRFLVADGATHFAHANGFAFYPTERLIVPVAANPGQDTVGAVALDRDGRIAAATSTGGTRNKMPGRVGDSPIIGCGGYADGFCGVSATGVGEYLMRVMMARSVAEAVERLGNAQDGATEGIAVLDTIRGQGGVICLDVHGRVGRAHNTPHMAGAAIDGEGNANSFV
jgi:beta-aspartyl-peptidase (threonine type)